jgi:hypothetical protein
MLVLDCAEKQAARYRARYGNKVTVVIDAFDLLPKSEEGRKAFGALLEWAKQQADQGDVTAVFVSGEGLGAHLDRRACAVVRLAMPRADSMLLGIQISVPRLVCTPSRCAT